MNKILSLFNISIVVLTTVSCASTLSKHYDEDNLGKDLKKLISSNEVNASDTAIMMKYIAFAKSSNEILGDKTYSYILDEGKKLKQKASRDLNSLKTVFESSKEAMNVRYVITNGH